MDYYQRSCHTILSIQWSDIVTNVEIVVQADISSNESMLLKYHLIWAGRICILEDHCVRQVAQYGEHSTGLRKSSSESPIQNPSQMSLTACQDDFLCCMDIAADCDV